MKSRVHIPVSRSGGGGTMFGSSDRASLATRSVVHRLTLGVPRSTIPTEQQVSDAARILENHAGQDRDNICSSAILTRRARSRRLAMCALEHVQSLLEETDVQPQMVLLTRVGERNRDRGNLAFERKESITN